MDIAQLQSFFMWCTIINGAILAFWIIWYAAAPDLVYRTQRRFFPLSREAFGVVMYAFLGAFKVLFLMFNFVPFVALKIVG